MLNRKYWQKNIMWYHNKGGNKMTIKEKVLSLLQNESLTFNEIAKRIDGNYNSVYNTVRFI